MAFLYPRVENTKFFLQKRYGRILPGYTTFVCFIWIINLEQFMAVWYLQLFALLVIAIVVYYAWHLLKKFPKRGEKLFYSFVVLQTLVLVVGLFILPHFVTADTIILPFYIKNFLFLLANITLTTPFLRDVPRLSGVFWSLAPEMYFYILYPFIVIPLIQLSKRWGWFISVIIIVGVTKILFDLDKEVVSLGALQSMNIARASGFVAGVTIGTIYQTRGGIWTKLVSLIKNPASSLLAIVLLIAMQWGDWAIRDGKSALFMNLYYLVASWIIAFIIINAIFPNSLIYKIFSKKVLVFLGIISYSIYLIHLQVITWASQLAGMLQPVFLTQGIHDLFYVIAVVLLTVAMS